MNIDLQNENMRFRTKTLQVQVLTRIFHFVINPFMSVLQRREAFSMPSKKREK